MDTALSTLTTIRFGIIIDSWASLGDMDFADLAFCIIRGGRVKLLACAAMASYTCAVSVVIDSESRCQLIVTHIA